MKKTERNILIMLIFAILSFVVCLIGMNSCIVYTPSVLQPSGVYEQWRAEQKAANDALYRYTQSAEYQQKYHGKNPNPYLYSPKANSIIGTKNDPLAGVRNSNNIPSSVSSQNYRITFR